MNKYSNVRIKYPRMATRWKLVPTKRHKQCASSSCDVYIGNRSRKCPKCSFVQPFSKKRKKSGDAPKAKRKKKEEVADGVLQKYYAGDRIYVFWVRKKCWVWATVESVRNLGGVLKDRTYTARLASVFQDETFQTGVNYYLENVNYQQMKIRKRFFKGDKSEKDCTYFLIKDLWTIPYTTSGQRETRIKHPTCDCNSCMSKYHNRINPAGTRSMFKTFNDLDLKIGSVVTVQTSNGYDKSEIIEIKPCVEPKYSFFKVKTFETMQKYNLNFKKPWFVYEIEFKDGTWKKYSPRDSNDIVAHIYNKFHMNKLPYTKFTHKMNNFLYEIDVDMKKIKWDIYGIQLVGTQRNTETNVVREIRFVRNQKPKEKKMLDFTSVIEKTMGKHNGVWLNNVDAITRFEQDMGKHKSIKHNNYKLLGCFKLARADNKKALQDRLAYYKSHGIECSIKKLFHGTYQQNLYPIIHPMGGFAMASESNGKAYGHGIYFGIDPSYCIDNGYAPPENDRLRCVIACDVIVGKKLDNGTDSSLKNASVRTGSSSNSVTFNPKDFELTGGSSSGSITVVFYDKIQTDIHITDVLWYR